MARASQRSPIEVFLFTCAVVLLSFGILSLIFPFSENISGRGYFIPSKTVLPVEKYSAPITTIASPQASPQVISVQTAMENLQTNSPVKWEIRWDEGTAFPKTLAGGISRNYEGPPANIAAEFFIESVPFVPPQDLIALREKRVPSGTKVTLQQMTGGLPVIGGISGIIVSEKGQVLHASSSLFDLPAIDATPKRSVDDAIASALSAIGVSSGSLNSKTQELAVFPSNPPKLAYDLYLTISTRTGNEPWHMVVDANEGTILKKKLLTQEAQGTGRVFKPNPVAKMDDPSFTDEDNSNDAIPLDAYDNVILENLDPPVGGLYSLKGSYAWMKNFEIPTNIPPTSASGDFTFLRHDKGFEEVMAYYTIDRSQSYIQSLGFTDVNNRPQEIDAHGLFNFDNSHYEPVPLGAGYISYGDGGVDDAEDADIILHEYGHAIQDNSAPGIYLGTADNGYGDETGSMAEGFSDYWAASNTYEFSLASGFPTNYIGEWDSTGYPTPAPYLRVVDSPKKYPADMVDKIHLDGQIWSATLWALFHRFGRENTGKIVLYSHFLVPTNPDFADGVHALMDADALLFPKEGTIPIRGVHYNHICEASRNRGLISCNLDYKCGDLNEDGFRDALDIGFMIDYLFQGITIPGPYESADLDGNGQADALDLGRLIDHIFVGAPEPTGCGRIPFSMRVTPSETERNALKSSLEEKGISIDLPEIK
ncbi:MAG: dockerin type I domain-containing protein [Candidatus Micrarchaeota archaeon]